MTLPAEVWQYPLVGALLLVVGWLLWHQREERRRVASEAKDERKEFQQAMALERGQHMELMRELLKEGNDERKQYLQSFQKILDELQGAMGEMCKTLSEHEERSAERHRDVVRRLERSDLGAPSR